MSLGQIVRAVVRPGCLDAPWRLPYGEGLSSGGGEWIALRRRRHAVILWRKELT
jgi:hypothetical protein